MCRGQRAQRFECAANDRELVSKPAVEGESSLSHAAGSEARRGFSGRQDPEDVEGPVDSDLAGMAPGEIGEASRDGAVVDVQDGKTARRPELNVDPKGR